MSLREKGSRPSHTPSRPPKRSTQQDACLSSVKRPRLCGGSPIWGAGSPSHVDKREGEPKAKKESHLSKVSILKKKPVVGKVNVNVAGVASEKASMVETEQEEQASGSGGYPIAREIGHGSISKSMESKFHEYMEAGAGIGKRFPSPQEDKPLTCKEMVDYEEDPDTVLAGEVSLSAATQPDGEDLPVIQSFSESQLGASMSSPMEGDRMGDEYMLFPGNVVDIPDCSDKEESEEAFAPSDMHVVIRSPTTSDDEFINSTSRQRGRKSSLAEQLFPGMDPVLREDLDSDSSNGSLGANEGKGSSDVVSGGVSKLQDEQISTKEDFEELIDERSRRGVQVPKQVHARFFTGAFKPVGFNQQAQVLSSETKLQSPQCLSVVTVPTTSTVATVGGSPGIGKHSSGKLTSIILHNATIRQNLISVPSLVTSAPPAITIVNASTSQIGSMLPSHITVPLISASAIRQLPNIKVIDKAQSSLSLATQAKNVAEGAPAGGGGEKQKVVGEKAHEPTKVSYHRIQNSFVKLLDASQNHKEAAAGTGAAGPSSTSPQVTGDGVHSKEPSPALAKPVDPPPVYSKVIQKLQVCGGDKELSVTTSGAGTPVMVRDSAPELKMTARVVHGKDPVMHITADDFNSADETKSVVISIPSPTPSQEQMLDNIALQALEGNRKDNNEFQSFEDMLDMIENITGETATILNEPKKVEPKTEHKVIQSAPETRDPPTHHAAIPAEARRTPEMKQQVAESQISVAVSSLSRSSVIPQLSPLSQPAELTSNMANVSQQLRSLLSSLHTTTTAAASSASSSNDSKVKNITHKLVATGSVYTGGPCLRVVDDSGNFLPVTGAGKSGMQQFLKVTHLQTSTQANTTLTNSVSSVISPSVNGAFSAKGGRAQEVIRGIHSMQSKMSSLSPSQLGANRMLFEGKHESPVKVNFSTQCKTQESSKGAGHGPMMVAGSGVADQRRMIGGGENNPDATKTSLSLSSMLQSHVLPEESGRHSVVIHPSGPSESHHQQHHLHHSQIDQTVTSSGVPQTTVVSTVPLIAPSITYNLGKILTSSEDTVTKVKYVRSNVIHSSTSARDDKYCGSGISKLDEIKKDNYQQDCGKSDSPQVTSVGAAGGESIVASRESLVASHNAPATKDEESNVLLKQLLQNTACANTQTPPASITTITTSLRQEPTSGSLLLESQLNKTAAAAPPPITAIMTPTPPAAQPKPPRFSVMSRETSFVSNPNPLPSQPVCTSGGGDSIMDRSSAPEVKKTPYIRTSSSEGILSSHPPLETVVTVTATAATVTESNLMLPTTQVIKKEPQSVVELPERAGLISSNDVKKEFMDESSQNSENSEVSRLDFNIKEETDSVDAVSEKAAFDKEELKKQKRRMYQQKRRQNLILNKELAGQPKKRARKSSKVEEDYDTYVDGILAQMQAFPPMTVLEPQLQKNYSVVPVYGSGDLVKFAAKNYSHRCGDLQGGYGRASIPDCSDYYDSKPYGELEPVTFKTSTTQREFYDLEFPPVKLESDEEKFFDLFCREDTPDSIVSSCCSDDEQPTDETVRFLGLRLIEKPEEKDRHVNSPDVPIVAPLPVRYKMDDGFDKEIAGAVMAMNKENVDMNLCSSIQEKTPAGKAAGNVTVTLTLMSSAAEDILGVLRDLANVLQIPVPTDYQIIEQTSSAPVGNVSGPLQKVPSMRTGLGSVKDKDSLDIQSILNGAAKFCKHCDIIIGNKGVLKKASELPFRDKVSGDQDELLFCGPTCYMQFSLMHKPPSLTDAKAIETLKLHSAMEAASLHGDVQLKGFPHDPVAYKGYHEQQQSTQRRTIDGAQVGRIFRGSRYKTWTPTALLPVTKYRKPSDKEMIELLYRLGITVAPAKIPEDTRRCIFCHGVGDGVADGPARLLNFDVDKWVHLNCGLWSDGVYETVNGALMNLEAALQQSLGTACIHCERPGATIRCFKTRCINVYHLSCAVKDGCVFYKNKTVFCIQHVPKGEKDNELTTLSVSRRVYVNRDENRQVAAVMHHSETGNILRVGSLILLSVGQLLPHQLQGFHSPHYIYPAGYKIVRFYWSMRHLNRRCRYVCSIGDAGGRPEFRVLVQEAPGEEAEFKGPSARNVWETVLEGLARLRRDNCRVQFFPKFVCGEDLFGLTEPAVVRVLESLPGIETLTDYKFKYGRNPLLELPLAINPTGCARSEPRARGQVHWKRPHTQRTAGASVRPLFGAAPQGGPGTASMLGDAACPYSKQFVHSKSSQYKKMKQEWRNNVYLARSKIQGLGLYAARDLEKHTMVIEYIGEIIRTELAETREKQYEAKNRGIYMFRLDEERVVDATLSGGLARYINHSCNPNCVAEIVEVDRDLRIIIFAKRRIQRGEELAYDYKFDIEDDQHKISCMCGAPNCRKWMN